MGTTIRREPVNFEIPASPNYKFLNVTNFRGLDVSSNPFELATNTASDCLNVYVDETNTLTTRPRLEKKLSLFEMTQDKRVTKAVSISTGYILFTYHITMPSLQPTYYYQSKTSTWHQLRAVPTGSLWHVPHNKPLVFEQNNFLYFIDNDDIEAAVRYWKADLSKELSVDEALELTPVEAYVPTTHVRAIDGSTTEVDKLNILTNKYKNAFVWDGVSDIHVKDGYVEMDNKYYENYNELYTEQMTKLNNDYELITAFTDGALLCYNKSTGAIVEITFDSVENLYNITDTGTTKPLSGTSRVESGTTAKAFWLYNGSTLSWHKKTNNVWSKIKDVTISNFDLQTVSPNGAVLLGGVRSDENIHRVEYNSSADEITRQPIFPNTYTWCMSDSAIYVAKLMDNNTLEVKRLDYLKHASYDNSDIFISPLVVDFRKINVTASDDVFYIFSNKHIIFVTNADSSTLTTLTLKEPIDPAIAYSFVIDDDTNAAYSWKYSKTGIKLYIAPNGLEWNDTYYTGVEIPHDANTTVQTYTVLKNTIVVRQTDSNTGREKIVYYSWTNNLDAHITATYELSSTESKKIYEHSSKFYNSILYARFDNNYWFVSENRYYRSINNDPTYIPITEYNDLGDSKENITGLNLANDTTLIAYKRNHLYLIQPFTSSLNTTEYTITESKNTVGNTAIGAPIVTTLTEIPLQINNDGVYGLSQLSNVSAVERVADLMSEPINERWLNIDDTLITNAQTMNRLYWTYIIIPYEEKSKTMIYLLDNRSNSWYYWELPIIVSNSFVKNNRAEFVDVEGNIYYLTNTDIENDAFDTLLVTEYYDDGHKLIPWFWQSQVLYLGTTNYSKRLVNTTFILTDTDTQDGYGLVYNYKVFRKLASSTPEKEISGELNLVRSTTKKTNISKFGFIQLKISNITEESQGTEAEKAYRNNKLRLVGLGLKYVLLEGLIR